MHRTSIKTRTNKTQKRTQTHHIQKIYTKSSNIQNTNTEQEGAKAEKQNQTKHVVHQLGLTNKEKRTKFFAFIAQVDTYPHTFLQQ